MFVSSRGQSDTASGESATSGADGDVEMIRKVKRLECALGDLKRTVLVAGHDFQEPIRNILSNCELVRRDRTPEDDHSADALHSIIRSAEGLRSSVQAVLAYCVATIPRESEWGETSLTFLCQEAELKLATVISTSKATILRNNLPVVHCDRNGMFQVFQNLIANSIKYRVVGQPPVVEITARPDGSRWIIEVADNGIGIDLCHAERIFDPFMRLHGAEIPGAGIGLAICRSVIEQHGGAIWCESSPTLYQGAVFCFTLLSKL